MGEGHNIVGEAVGAFRVAPWVTHQRIDDEVIAIDLETGAYYSLEGVGAHVWSLLDESSPADDAVNDVMTHFEVDADRARSDVEALFGRLAEERLIEAAAKAPARATGSAPGERRPYETPKLEKFSDLEELLLLDPIHEVDEAGWPIQRDD
jgi:hypothetical protein